MIIMSDPLPSNFGNSLDNPVFMTGPATPFLDIFPDFPFTGVDGMEAPQSLSESFNPFASDAVFDRFLNQFPSL
jgi:hypothetical protein